MKTETWQDIEIEPLGDSALELMAGGKSSEGPKCCSCSTCSGAPPRFEEEDRLKEEASRSRQKLSVQGGPIP